jgi:hypothetical protein
MPHHLRRAVLQQPHARSRLPPPRLAEQIAEHEFALQLAKFLSPESYSFSKPETNISGQMTPPDDGRCRKRARIPDLQMSGQGDGQSHLDGASGRSSQVTLRAYLFRSFGPEASSAANSHVSSPHAVNESGLHAVHPGRLQLVD